MRPIPPEILAVYPMRPSESVVAVDGLPSDRLGLWPDGPHARTGPHPGFRVGQVWAWIWMDQVYSAAVTQAHPTCGLLTQDTGRWIVEAAGVRIWRVDATQEHLPAWLLADPCCPWLAPWGPTRRGWRCGSGRTSS